MLQRERVRRPAAAMRATAAAMPPDSRGGEGPPVAAAVVPRPALTVSAAAATRACLTLCQCPSGTASQSYTQPQVSTLHLIAIQPMRARCHTFIPPK